MEGFVNLNNEEFKTPQSAFIQELNAVEKYTNSNADALARMSLYNQFDPLISTAKPLSPKMEEAEDDLLKSVQKSPRDNKIIVENAKLLSGHTDVIDADVTMNLVQINSPKVDHVEANGNINGNLNESPYKDLFSQLLNFHHQTVAICQELQNQLAEKNETIDNLEGQLFDLHAKYEVIDCLFSVLKLFFIFRYENLRTASKEYSKNTESHFKEQIDSMHLKQQEKDEESRKLMMQVSTRSEELHRLVQNVISQL